MPVIPFAEWRPDVAMLNSAYASDVLNVLPTDGGYIPFPQVQAITVALAAQPLGGFVAKTQGGDVHIFAGTAAKLYRFNSGTDLWDDVSQAATTYVATAANRWRFAQFGNYVIAVNINDAPQVFQLGVSTEFADLGGSPPQAAYVAVWGDFLVLGGLSGNQNRVHWSALNDITGWTAGTNSSDYQDFPDGGAVTGMTNANNPLIFQEKAIRRGIFIPGSTEVFAFDKLHDNRGAKAPHSIAQRGHAVLFLDGDGFHLINHEGETAPVGFEKVNRYFRDNAWVSRVAEMVCQADPVHQRFYCAFATNDTDFFNNLLIFDINHQKWSRATISTYYIMPAVPLGTTLEELDNISSSIDALPFSLDSAALAAGSPVMGSLGTDYKLGFFAGGNAEATLITQEVGSTDGQIMLVKDLYPIIDTDQTLVSTGSRLRRSDVVSYTVEAAQSSNTGIVHKRSRSRFHRFKARVPEETEWTFAQGIDVTPQPMGRR